jgi:hypothetical protein
VEWTARAKNDDDRDRQIEHEAAKTALQTVEKNAESPSAAEFIGAGYQVPVAGDGFGKV